jgi:uncharacterized protein
VQTIADRYVAALRAGVRDPELYAEDCEVWRNTTDTTEPLRLAPSRTRLQEAGALLELTDVRADVHSSGFLLRYRSVATLPDGHTVTVPACVVATVADGHIVRLEEYADSAQAARLLTLLADSDR